jgi:hypothetical protein
VCKQLLARALDITGVPIVDTQVCIRIYASHAFVGHYSPSGAKMTYKMKESTMLPQAMIAFA